MSEIAGAGCIEDIGEVARLYARDAVRVRRLVALDVRAPDVVIEDACQIAWMRLVAHRARIRRDTATRWVVRVARHEAYRHVGRGARETSLEELDAPGERAPAPALPLEIVARRERLQSIRDLPDRQRRLMWLQALGFSYAEMAGATGDSRRTVERQLLRAKDALARMQPAA